MIENWEAAHFIALTPVDRDMGIRYYRKCGIPGSKNLKTNDEMEAKFKNECAMFLITLLVMHILK